MNDTRVARYGVVMNDTQVARYGACKIIKSTISTFTAHSVIEC